jgi:ClpP class serine protease
MSRSFEAYPQLWSRIYGRPLAIEPQKAKVIEEVFRGHVLGGSHVQQPSAQQAERHAPGAQERRTLVYAGLELQNRPEKPYALTRSGIALLPVIGTLVQRGSWLDAMSGLTSYDRIGALLERSIADPDVKAILLEIDSPGGETYGLLDAASRITAAASVKPIWAQANEMAYSAAYWLASAAQRVYAPVTGGVGSIGVVALHVNQAPRDKAMGYEYSFVYAGTKKVDLTSHAPLSERGRAWLQAEVDRIHELFIGEVARQRGMAAGNVRATEAALLSAPDAHKAGFIDGIATLRETVRRLESSLQRPAGGVSSRAASAPAKASDSAGPRASTLRPATRTSTAAEIYERRRLGALRGRGQ